MAQHDMNIANQGFPAFRTDLNNALTAINTSHSGTSRPSGAAAGTIWLDTTSSSSPTLKYYDGSDDISLCTINHSANTVNWLDSTVVADLVGDTTPQLGGNLDTNSQNILIDDDHFIADENGNEQIIFQTTGSAVNELEVKNATTGNGPILGSSGETNVDLNLNPKGSGVLKSGTKAVKIAGKETIWVPANAMIPTNSNGCSDLTKVETTSGRPDLNVLDFDDGSDEHAQFAVAFPKSWNLGTITFQVFWTSTATDTDGVSWALQGVGMGDNETQDAAYGTAIVVDDACQSAAEELYVTAESSAVTIAGTPADDDLTYFRIFRDVSDSNDTATEDARLIGVKIFFTTDSPNDA